MYKPGLHIIADIETRTNQSLYNVNSLKEKLVSIIHELDLEIVGEVYHDFPNAGFTLSICLTESHLAIHTWPEYNKVTMDVFLSNNYKVNDDKGREIIDFCLTYFHAKTKQITELKR